MVVGDEDIARLTFVEGKDDAILVIDANAVFTSEVALELLEFVARTAQIAQILRVLQRVELAARYAPEGLWDTSSCFRTLAIVDVARRVVREARYH
jgi:hypothetical protein